MVVLKLFYLYRCKNLVNNSAIQFWNIVSCVWKKSALTHIKVVHKYIIYMYACLNLCLQIHTHTFASSEFKESLCSFQNRTFHFIKLLRLSDFTINNKVLQQNKWLNNRMIEYYVFNNTPIFGSNKLYTRKYLLENKLSKILAIVFTNLWTSNTKKLYSWLM